MSHLQDEFADWLGEILAASGVAPELLELEMIESAVIADPEDAAAKLAAARRLGVALAIGGFGTGHSSLSHLKRLPFDRLKIDRSFIRNIASDPDDGAIVSAIIAMAHHLKIEVVAEGVESEQQLELLHLQRCDFVQGQVFGRPLAALDVVPWHRDWQRRQRASRDQGRFGTDASAGDTRSGRDGRRFGPRDRTNL
jgi:EAL domain-containing protein (putative c-di-GMP-specific phosphodiesterase class I)